MKPNLLVFALALCALTGAARATVPGADAEALMEWTFRVFLDDREIGFHDFRVRNDGATRRVEARARFDVRILFVNAYRYRHQATETWADNCLLKMESRTDDNGSNLHVVGAVQDEAFLVSTGSGHNELPPCLMTFAYWNPDFLKAKALLNAQTGVLEPVTVTPRGETTVAYAGEALRATRYDLSLQGRDISLWYGLQDQRWLALETPAEGGRLLRYEPVRLPTLSIADGAEDTRGR